MSQKTEGDELEEALK